MYGCSLYVVQDVGGDEIFAPSRKLRISAVYIKQRARERGYIITSDMHDTNLIVA
jgi:hypothetical protein